ncbi:MAG: DUF2589 domain-containing protein [Chromatiales bacterium]|jgi:hypothetical protein
MADGLVNMSSQFKGLPMGDLIGGPLDAACDAQIRLAGATADFIKVVGFLPPADGEDKKNGTGDVRTAIFKFNRPVEIPGETAPAVPGAPNGTEIVELEVPMLALVKIPNLSINTVDVTFDMEVKSSTSDSSSSDEQASLEGQAKVGWGPFSASVKIQGSVSAHQEHTRTSDNSAKYHVEVHAQDVGTPEGLARVLDILQTASVPKAITRQPAAAS